MSSSGDGTSKGMGKRQPAQPVRERIDAQFSFQMKRHAAPPTSGSVIMHKFKEAGQASARNVRDHAKERIQEVEEEFARELNAETVLATEGSAGPSGSSTSLSDTSAQGTPRPRSLLEGTKPNFRSAFAAIANAQDAIASEHVPATKQRLGRSFDEGLRPTNSLRHQHSASNLSAFKADMFRDTDIPRGTARPFASSMSNVIKPLDMTKSTTQVSTTTSSAVPSYTTSKRGHTSMPKSRFHATTDVLFSNLHKLDPLRLLETMQLRSLLGVGSMGTVYNALVMGQRVVCKIMEHEGGVMKRDRERLAHAQREADISQLLVHPNIVTTYFAYSGPLQLLQLNTAKAGTGPSRATKEVTVLVQELCAGGTLRSVIDKGTLCDSGDDEELRLNFFKVVVQLGVQVAYALVHAHAAGVLHCDLKAENILLQPIPEEQRFPEELYLRVKVSDFGIATVLPSAEVDKGVMGGVHGTVSHMPPEALRQPHHISPKTDIWSLGVVLWEVWTGQVPYEGCTPQQVIASVCSGKPLDWPPKTPPLLIDIVKQCWQLDPDNRPNAVSLAERLAKVCGVLIAVDTDLESTEASRNLSMMPSKALADLDEEALEAALLEDDFAKLQEALDAQQGEEDDEALGHGEEEGEEEAEDPLTGPPPTDDVALSMWQLLHVRDLSECTTSQVTPNRQMLTAPLPFLNLEKYVDVDDSGAADMLWRRAPESRSTTA